MRRLRLRLLSVFIFLLMIILATVNVGYSQSTTMSMDPSSTVDDSLQAPSTFTVDVNLFDAANVFSWQYNMSWDPSILQCNDIVVGSYLEGNPDQTKDSIAVDHYSLPSYSSLTNPYSSHDGYLGTYASLQYSELDGEFWLTTFGTDVAESFILQVDLSVKYSATASSAGDQYRIYWDLFGMQTTLVGWTSAAAPLDTHVWTNIPCPMGYWMWGYIMATKIVVGTNLDGGDPTAVIDLYEAWLTVTYQRPTVYEMEIDNVDGWGIIYQTTYGAYMTGISGSGLLATMTFQVLDYGWTELAFNDTLGVLEDPMFNLIPFTAEDGYFRNLYPGDVDGDKYVGSADAGVLALGYGEWRGDPNYVREADFDDDGYIGSYDAGVLATTYGTTYP